jgi:hypothetical protein
MVCLAPEQYVGEAAAFEGAEEGVAGEPGLSERRAGEAAEEVGDDGGRPHPPLHQSEVVRVQHVS